MMSVLIISCIALCAAAPPAEDGGHATAVEDIVPIDFAAAVVEVGGALLGRGRSEGRSILEVGHDGAGRRGEGTGT